MSLPALPSTGRWIFCSTGGEFALSKTALPVLRREESARYPCSPLSLITGRWPFFPYTYLYSLEGCFRCVRVDENEMIDIHSSSTRYCERGAVCSVCINSLWKGSTCDWGLRRVRCGMSLPALPSTGRWIFCSTGRVFALSRTALPVLRREESARYPCSPLSLINGRWPFFPYTYLYSLEGCFRCVRVDEN